MIHPLLHIPLLHLPLENFVVWENGFSDEDIKQIIALGELSEFKKGQVGGASSEDSITDSNIRDTDIAWIDPEDRSRWLYDRFGQFAAQINHDKYQFDLSHFQPLQYGTYRGGGHYTWHYDSGPNMPEHRKLSFVLGLTDPNEYEGGELQININGNCETPHSIKIRRGDLIVFPSYVAHRVTPVTSGERRTLVGWACGPKFK